MSDSYDIILNVRSDHTFDLENLIYLKLLTDTSHKIVIVIDDNLCIDDIVKTDILDQIDLLQKYGVVIDKIVQYSSYITHVLLYGMRLEILGYLDNWKQIAHSLYIYVISDILRIDTVYTCPNPNHKNIDDNHIHDLISTLQLNNLHEFERLDVIPTEHSFLRCPTHLLSIECVQSLMRYKMIGHDIRENGIRLLAILKSSVFTIDGLIKSDDTYIRALIDPVQIKMVDSFACTIDRYDIQVSNSIWVDSTIMDLIGKIDSTVDVKVRLRFGTAIVIRRTQGEIIGMVYNSGLRKKIKASVNWIPVDHATELRSANQTIIVWTRENDPSLSLVRYRDNMYYTIREGVHTEEEESDDWNAIHIRSNATHSATRTTYTMYPIGCD